MTLPPSILSENLDKTYLGNASDRDGHTLFGVNLGALYGQCHSV